jgi:hypothetical protein
VTALAYTAVGVILAGCGAYAWDVLDGRQRIAYLRRAARYHITRRRYARRMRGPLPASEQDIPYDRRSWLAALDAWEAPAVEPERTRT